VSTAFHLALPVNDLKKAKEFYSNVLGLQEHRSSFNWIDFDFFGHQLSLQLVKDTSQRPEGTLIDGDQVPAMHYGMILDQTGWEALRDRLAGAGVNFIIGPRIRFEGKEGEQGTFFIVDPSGNYLEFKYFSDTSRGTWY
jgi:extradiol dioxygenase family protein